MGISPVALLAKRQVPGLEEGSRLGFGVCGVEGWRLGFRVKN